MPGDVFLLLVSLSSGRKFYSKKCPFPSFGLPFLTRSSQDPFCILVVLKHSRVSWVGVLKNNFDFDSYFL